MSGSENMYFRKGENWYVRCAKCRTVREQSASRGFVNIMAGNTILSVICSTCFPEVCQSIRDLFPKGPFPVVDDKGVEVVESEVIASNKDEDVQAH